MHRNYKHLCVLNSMLKLNENLIHSLKSLGLSKYEILIYPHLVHKKSATVSDIYKLLNIAKPRIYEALDSLENRGFIYKQDVKPTQYIAVDPESAISQQTRSQIQALKESQSSAINQLEQFVNETDDENPIPDFWFIKGRSQIYLCINQMMEKTQEHARISVNDVGLRKLLVYESRNHIHKKLRKEGKTISLMCYDIQNESMIEKAKKFADVKVIDRVFPRSVLIDNMEMGMVLNIPKDTVNIQRGDDMILFSKNPGYVEMYTSLFDTYWEHFAVK